MFINIILTLLTAVLVWSVSFVAIHWTKDHVSLALLSAILGAVLIAAILILKKKFVLVGKDNVVKLLLLATGAAIGISLAAILVPCIQVRISCSQQPPYATPDETIAHTGDVICWLPSNVTYTVEFKPANLSDPQNGGRRSPVRNSSGSEEISVRVLTSVSSQRTVDVLRGYFKYNILCDNGYHYDPKVRVPPQ